MKAPLTLQLLGFFTVAASTIPSVFSASLLIYADSTNPTNVGNVVATIDGTGILSAAVATFDGEAANPTLAQLQAYDSVLVWANDSFLDPDGVGDALADYVDSGGGVVIATFANVGGELGGRFEDGAYHPIAQAPPSFGPANLTLGNTPDPNHPILTGVVSFDGGSSSFRSSGSAAAGSTVVAEWSNGDPLIVEVTSFAGSVIGLNFLPPSSTSESGSWLPTTDGGIILANALAHGGGQPVPEPDTGTLLLFVIGAAIVLRKRIP